MLFSEEANLAGRTTKDPVIRFGDFVVFCLGDGNLRSFAAGDWSEVNFDKTRADGIMLPDFSLHGDLAKFEGIVCILLI